MAKIVIAGVGAIELITGMMPIRVYTHPRRPGAGARAGPGRQDARLGIRNAATRMTFAIPAIAAFKQKKPEGSTTFCGDPAVRTQLRHLSGIVKQLFADDHGAEIIEYALILGIIVVVTIATVQAFGMKVFAKWTSVNASM